MPFVHAREEREFLRAAPASLLVSELLQRAFKRLLDLVVSVTALVVLAPAFLVLIAIVKRDGGPVFYSQPRVGRKGVIFQCWKFRTMVVDADRRLQEMLDRDPAARKEFEEYQKLQNDPRVTPWGQFLRRYSLDELPQLLNILRGEMSLVGPRPRPVEEYRLIKSMSITPDPYTQVKPGLTGLWQISGRSRTKLSEKVLIDAHYIENWSITRDIWIILSTFRVVLKGEGAC